MGSGPRFPLKPRGSRAFLSGQCHEFDRFAGLFADRFEGIAEEYKPWVVALPHLGGTGGGKEVRKKAEQAVQIARRRLSGGPVTVTSGGGAARIRVRRPD